MKLIKSLAPVYILVIGGLLGAVLLGNHAVTAAVQNMPLQRRSVFIIDAGHGGEDGGATSCTGILESHINLEISLRLNDLMHLLGYETRMIRTTDKSVYTQGDTIAAKKVSDLKQRVKLVNETENGILISIHQNHFSDSRYSGAQVFYSAHEQSRHLATQLQTAFANTINLGSNRKCKRADKVYLMEQIECPGVLIECGFLSNRTEEAALRDAVYQKKLCCVIGSVLSRHAASAV